MGEHAQTMTRNVEKRKKTRTFGALGHVGIDMVTHSSVCVWVCVGVCGCVWGCVGVCV